MLFNNTHHDNKQIYNLKYTSRAVAISPCDVIEQPSVRAGFYIMYDLFNQPELPIKEPNCLTQELVKRIFDYKEGFLYWKIKFTTKINIGQKAGCLAHFKRCDRYVIKINGFRYLSSRVIFLWHEGWLPEVVDHRNHDTLNDNIDNLRAADKYKNAQNVSSRKNSTSQYLGVYFNRDKKWVAQIRINDRSKYIGVFDIEKNAACAYNEAAKKHFGEFANLNIIE